MTRLNTKGYIEVMNRGGKKNPNSKGSFRDFFTVRATNSRVGIISLGAVVMPKEYIGKRVKFKVEVEE